MAVLIPAHFLQQILLQAERDYPNETCGILVGSKDREEVTAIYPCRNVQDEYHAQDPMSFPRTARTAYFIEPKTLLLIQRENRQRDQEMRVIYHSHIDAGAYFSEEDQRIAVSDGRPVYPDVSYLVISVQQGKVKESALFEWDEKTKNFIQNRNKRVDI